MYSSALPDNLFAMDLHPRVARDCFVVGVAFSAARSERAARCGILGAPEIRHSARGLVLFVVPDALSMPYSVENPIFF